VANFDLAYPLTVNNEGYYVSQEWARAHGDNHSGETYMGVDRIANPTWPGWKIIDQYKATNGPIPYNTRLPVSLGLEDLVKQYAKQNYWDVIKGDQIADQGVAQMIFEQKWGGYSGIQGVQKVINSLIAPDSIKVDGGIGPDTLAKINSLPPDTLHDALYNERLNWINTVGQKVNANAVKGWTDRLKRFERSITGQVLQTAQSVSAAASDFVADPVAAVKKNPVIFIGGLTMVFTSLALLVFIVGKIGKKQEIKTT